MQQRSQATRAGILAAARKLFSQHGYDATGVAELCAEAGVSKGALVEIEGCRANPSIALLCRLAAAMGVSVADFVDVSSKPTVHLIAEDEIPELWAGEKGGRYCLCSAGIVGR